MGRRTSKVEKELGELPSILVGRILACRNPNLNLNLRGGHQLPLVAAESTLGALAVEKFCRHNRRVVEAANGRTRQSIETGGDKLAASYCSGNFRSAKFTTNSTSKRLIGLVVLLLLLPLPLLALGQAPGALSAASKDPIQSDNSSTLIRLKKATNRHYRNQQQSANDEILVQTKAGLFKGILLSSAKDQNDQNNDNAKVVGFLGIRYASAPVKRLRFMPPTVYHYAPNQVHEMQKFGPICKQRWPFGWRGSGGQTVSLAAQLRLMRAMLPTGSFAQFKPLMEQLVQLEQSEDCLNLNIYLPLKAIQGRSGEPSLLPVLVIIHGESFDYGAGSTQSGLKLVEQTEIIVITFNFRLNILGFPPPMAGTTMGNLGLMDQVAALHWIKDNIQAFGGSPGNITLMGTQRGAIFVNLLMVSPLTKGLFQAAIMEDGSALTPLVAANHIIGPPAQQQQQSAAVQHVRLLAKLCDCPSPPPPHHFQPAANSTTSQQQPPQLDESKMDALTFECLRHKPVDQLLQPVALDLLHLSAATGQLVLAGRWLQNLSNSDSEHSSSAEVAADADLWTRLVAQASREQLAASGGEQASELFGAIFGLQQQQQTRGASLRPLWAPTLDGTIARPGEDLAAGMLKPGSQFGQRHLLIGLSRPILPNLPREEEEEEIVSLEEDHVVQDGEQEDAEAKRSFSPRHLGDDSHTMMTMVTTQMEREGLSSEQALELVNRFVRSFYRYHNQEIANSIIANYLSSSHLSGGGRKRMPPKQKQNKDKLLLLESLLEAFQDALIYVPVLKTGLIHASRQLEPLAEVFAARQFEQQRLANGNNSTTGELLESFVPYALSLYNDPGWPLELRSTAATNQPPLSQPKSTYLYQLDADLLVGDVGRAIQRMLARLPKPPTVIWRALREILQGLLIRLQSAEFRQKLSLNLPLKPADSDQSYIYSRFTSWLSSRLASILGQFVKTGSLGDLLPAKQTGDTFNNMLGDTHNAANLSADCLKEDQSLSNERGFHFASESCRRQLNELAFDLLLNELTTKEKVHPSGGSSWQVFNLFSQQVATLPALLNVDQSQWPLVMRSTWEEGGQLHHDRSSFLTRGSFWSNFVPALNCSKTQPINPSSLLGASHQPAFNLNSSLLHLNLAFSCSQGGKTSFNILESLGTTIRQSVEAKFEQLNKLSRSQHHQLRMANMSGGNSLELTSSSSQHGDDAGTNNLNQEPPAANESHKQLATSSSSLAPIDAPAKAVELRTKYAGLVLVVCVLLIAATLTTGVCALIKQKRQRKQSQPDQKREQEQQKGEPPGNLVINHDNNLSPAEFVEEPKSQQEDPHSVDTVQFVDCQPAGQDEQYLIGAADASQPIEVAAFHQQQPIYYNSRRSNNHPIGGSHQDLFSSNPIELCKSHSMLKISNNGLVIAASSPIESAYHHQPASMTPELGPTFELKPQQQLEAPIMVPLQKYPSASQAKHSSLSQYGQTVARVQPSCMLTTNGGYAADSSSETQGQTSSVTSLTKKRVKISEPIGMVKRGGGGSNNRKQRAVEMVSSSSMMVMNNGQQPDSLYCPMHGGGRDQTSNNEAHQPSTTYFIEDTFQLQPANIELWDGSHLEHVNLHLVEHPAGPHHHYQQHSQATTTLNHNCNTIVEPTRAGLMKHNYSVDCNGVTFDVPKLTNKSEYRN